MKRLSLFAVAAFAALGSFSVSFAQTAAPAAAQSARPGHRKVDPEFAKLMNENAAFVQTYFRNPNPDGIPELLRKFDKAAAITPLNPVAVTPLIGFFMEVFRSNPARVDGWMELVDSLQSPQLRESVLNGLLFAGTETTKAAAKKYIARHPEYKDVDPYDLRKPGFLDGEIRNPTKISACWGAYFASGKQEYPQAVLACAVREPDANNPVDILSVRSARLGLIFFSQKNPELKKMLSEFLKNATPAQKTGFAMVMSEEMQKQAFGSVLYPQKRVRPHGEQTPAQ